MVCTLNGGRRRRRGGRKTGKRDKSIVKNYLPLFKDLNSKALSIVQDVKKLGLRSMKYAKTIRKKSIGYR